MSVDRFLFVGTDIGASAAKTAVIDETGKILGWAVSRSGADFAGVAERLLDQALEKAGLARENVRLAVSTGYGRKNVAYSEAHRTEISCHAAGCYHYFPEALTVIDIGGQDNKIIKIDSSGSRVGFKMNRKCAAGTGAFLEEMSLRLDIPLQDMDAMARKAETTVVLGSYCTVFTATEVLEKIRAAWRCRILSRAFITPSPAGSWKWILSPIPRCSPAGSRPTIRYWRKFLMSCWGGR